MLPRRKYRAGVLWSEISVASGHTIAIIFRIEFMPLLDQSVNLPQKRVAKNEGPARDCNGGGEIDHVYLLRLHPWLHLRFTSMPRKAT